MTTISKAAGRGDLLLHAGCDEGVGVLWEEDCQDGNGYVAKDLSSWRAELVLTSPTGEDWGKWDCTCTHDGYAIAKIPGYDTSGEEWLSRANGKWKMQGYGPQAERELLGWGYFSMVS